MQKKLLILTVFIILAVLVNYSVWVDYFKLFLNGMDRKINEIDTFKNVLSYFFVPPVETNSLYHNMLYYLPQKYFPPQNSGISGWFSGFVALWLVLSSLIIFSRRCFVTVSDDFENSRFYIRALFFSGSVLFLISLGKSISFFGDFSLPNPVFSILTRTPILSSTRFIAHYAYPALSLFSIVGAIALSKTKFFSKRQAIWVSGLLGLIMLIEMYPNYSKTNEIVSKPPVVYSFLNTLKPRSGAIYLPFPAQINSADPVFYKQFEYMRYANLHSLWLVNGITGFFPPEYVTATRAFKSFPSVEGYLWIAKNHLEYIILDKSVVNYEKSVNYFQIRKCSSLVSLYKDANYEVFRIIKPQYIFEQCANNVSIKTDHTYELGNRSSVKSSNPFFFQYGWSNQEDWGIWSEGRKSRMTLFFPETVASKKYRILFDAWVFGQTGKSKKVGVIINNKVIKNITFDSANKREKIELNFNGKLIRNRILEIEFLNYNPQSPLSLGYSSDARELGIGLFNMKISIIGENN